MRHDHIVISMLTLLGLATLIGTHVLVSCLLAIGIVAAYGTSMRILLGRNAERGVAATLVSIVLALGALATGAFLVHLWSAALQQTFLSSLALWSAIFGASATWAVLATWLEERGHGANVLRAVYVRQSTTLR